MAIEDVNSDYTGVHCKLFYSCVWTFFFLWFKNHWFRLAFVGRLKPWIHSESGTSSGMRRCDVWYRVNGFHILRLIYMNAIIQLCPMRIRLIRYVTTNHREFNVDPLHTDNDFIRTRLLSRMSIVSNAFSVPVQGTHIVAFSSICPLCVLRIASMVHVVFFFYFFFLKITLRT